jgi:hypothetical protein
MNKGESHGVHRADCQRSDLRIVIRPIRSRRFQSANGSAAAPLKPVITHYKRRGTNSNPYNGVFSESDHDEWTDSPSIELTVATWLRRTDSFKAYLMFQPKPYMDSIAVPMFKVDWNWSGTVRTNGPPNSWTLVASVLPTNYQASVTETLPIWSHNITNNIVVTPNLPCFDEN